LTFLDTGFLYALIDADDANHASFVDCVSFVVMEKLGIQIAWSVDSDFSHRFTAVPGPIS
jgi:predicted nucleic acid-binding protein